MMDEGHELTEKQLAALERRIAKAYQQAGKELQGTIVDYFEKFKARDEEMKALIGTVINGKEWTEQDYKQWRLNQMARGERYIALRDKVAKRMTDANEVAVAYTNDATPGIYSLNRNYAAYTIERVSDKADFTLWDEQTVKRLIVEEPNLMPYYPKKRALQRGIDLAYGKKQITASVTSAILQGKSIKGIADDLQERITTMSRVSAIRTARTAVTGAQNAGRMDSYVAAQKMGIKLKREWLATLDNRTRHAHAMLDGQQAEMGKPFKVDGYEIMFPGDRSAPAYLVYNCRCIVLPVNVAVLPRAGAPGVLRGICRACAPDRRGGDQPLVGAVHQRVKACRVLDLAVSQLQRGHFLPASPHSEVQVRSGDVFALEVGPHGLFLRRSGLLRGDFRLVVSKRLFLSVVLRLKAAIARRFQIVQLLLNDLQLFEVTPKS